METLFVVPVVLGAANLLTKIGDLRGAVQDRDTVIEEQRGLIEALQQQRQQPQPGGTDGGGGGLGAIATDGSNLGRMFVLGSFAVTAGAVAIRAYQLWGDGGGAGGGGSPATAALTGTGTHHHHLTHTIGGTPMPLTRTTTATNNANRPHQLLTNAPPDNYTPQPVRASSSSATRQRRRSASATAAQGGDYTDTAAIEDDDDDDDAAACVICSVNQRDSVLLPCRHLCLCWPCKELILQPGGDKRCPLCRTPVTGATFVFVA